MYYINTFFIYSIIGYIFEIIINIISKQKPTSGILYGPWTPIYGIGAVLILIITKKVFKTFKFNKIVEVIIALLIIAVVLTFIEWLGGVLIEKVFHTSLWNYKKFKFNIGKYIALEVTGVWVIGSLIILYFIQPLLNKIINLIPKYFTYILMIIMIIDIFFTIFNKRLGK